MAYFSESQLIDFSQTPLDFVYRSNIKESRFKAAVSIFLSHSHKDRDMVLGLLNYLARLGISLYVDWQDSNMPRVMSRETADRIKARIEELDGFLILATRNALVSRWVPWEVGIADTRKALQSVAIIPVADPQGIFHGNEYLQLYRRIELGPNNELQMFKPNSSIGLDVKSWFQRMG